MAHGIGGTRDSGLLPFAEAFARGGLDALLFDYRNFGDSSGEPRQLGLPHRHRDDYRAAVEFARGLEGVDPERVVLWGTSWSGGHVTYVAADDPRIAAIVCQAPDLDGLRTLREISRCANRRQLARLTWAGFVDGARAVRGEPPHLIPLVAPPGQLAAMASPDAYDGYHAIAGPTWRNEISARSVIAELLNRAINRIERVRCPILVQIADRDAIAPPRQARAAAWRAKGRVEVHEYPCEHFDVYLGDWRDRAVADQLHFLGRHLGAALARQPASLTSEP